MKIKNKFIFPKTREKSLKNEENESFDHSKSKYLTFFQKTLDKRIT